MSNSSVSNAALYVVATPIGNLEDITLRAIRILKSVSLILCEDTRRASILCNHYGIRVPRRSCYAHNEQSAAQVGIAALEKGGSVAYISDAGTPTISDPGARLVAAVREAGVKIIPIPGVSSVTTLLSVSGVAGSVSFIGFLPRGKNKRAAILQQLIHAATPSVVYESPHRMLKLLQEIVGIDPHCLIIVGRELTKIHEEIVKDLAQQMLAYYTNRPIKGEFTLVIVPKKR